MNSHIFAEWAPVYARMGLVTFPVTRDKVPAVKHWPNFEVGTHAALLERFADSNVGVLDGAKSGITRVDVDDAGYLEECIERFGATPVVVRTPSGGWHLYYRFTGEKRRLRLDSLPIDVLGEGGFGLVPPSKTDSGSYEFVEGGPEALGDLPAIKEQIEPRRAEMREGDGRNNELFQCLLDAARNIRCVEDFRQMAHETNAAFAEPLPEVEVDRTSEAVWRYKQEGRLYRSGDTPTAMLMLQEVQSLSGSELRLWSYLRCHHGARRDSFVLAREAAYALDMSPRTLRKAQRGLIEKGLLSVEQEGVQGRWHPWMVRLNR